MILEFEIWCNPKEWAWKPMYMDETVKGLRGRSVVWICFSIGFSNWI